VSEIDREGAEKGRVIHDEYVDFGNFRSINEQKRCFAKKYKIKDIQLGGFWMSPDILSWCGLKNNH
jgi:hypothetical protein